MTTAIAIHQFDSTAEAYDRSQCDDNIHDGDVLAVPSEGVYGFLFQAWPVAVTTETGAFHTGTSIYTGGVDVEVFKPYLASVLAAANVAMANDDIIAATQAVAIWMSLANGSGEVDCPSTTQDAL